MAKLIGNQPNQVPTNGDLGTMAYQDSDNVVVGNLSADGAVVINESGADVDFRIESDTRTNAFFLDGATGNVGIGTSSPQSRTEIIGSVSDFSSGTFSRSNAILTLYNSNITGANQGSILAFDSEYDDGGSGGRATFALIKGANDTWGNTGSGNLQFFTSAPGAASSLQERMRIDSSGNVGIGTSSPSQLLDVSSSGTPTAIIQTTASSSYDAKLIIRGARTTTTTGEFCQILFETNDSAAAGDQLGFITAGKDVASTNQGVIRFGTTGTDGGTPTERMRIDSSGNLLVGKTSTSTPITGAEGIELRNSGLIGVGKNGGICAYFGRNTDDGGIVEFRKGGTNVGSIGTLSGLLGIGNGDAGLLMAGSVDAIAPWNASTNATRDAAINLGTGTNRWKDLYLSGGVYLGGTGSANYLDDYEEGTWTPTITSSGAAGSVTYNERSAIYTKIGNLVQVQADIRISGNTNTLSGTLKISGLPFTVNSSSGRATGVISGGAFATAVAGIAAYPHNSTTYARVFGATSAPYTSTSDLPVSVINDSTAFYFSVIYISA